MFFLACFFYLYVSCFSILLHAVELFLTALSIYLLSISHLLNGRIKQKHAKEIAASFGEGKKVRDCVITVPSYFTQHERSAVYTAAEIADLKILSLVEENTAAALHYGIDRTPEGNKTNTVLFYNMGAGKQAGNLT